MVNGVDQEVGVLDGVCIPQGKGGLGGRLSSIVQIAFFE